MLSICASSGDLWATSCWLWGKRCTYLSFPRQQSAYHRHPMLCFVFIFHFNFIFSSCHMLRNWDTSHTTNQQTYDLSYGSGGAVVRRPRTAVPILALEARGLAHVCCIRHRCAALWLWICYAVRTVHILSVALLTALHLYYKIPVHFNLLRSLDVFYMTGVACPMSALPSWFWDTAIPSLYRRFDRRRIFTHPGTLWYDKRSLTLANFFIHMGLHMNLKTRFVDADVGDMEAPPGKSGLTAQVLIFCYRTIVRCVAFFFFLPLVRHECAGV